MPHKRTEYDKREKELEEDHNLGIRAITILLELHVPTLYVIAFLANAEQSVIKQC